MFADIVHKQCTDSPSVVCGCDCPISLLTCCVPYLCLDGLGVYLDGSCSEFDANRGFRIEIELIACEPTKQVGFTDAGVSNEDDCESRVSWVPDEA